MRPIKFRGKSIETGKWVEGYLADIITGVTGFEDRAIIVPSGTALAIAVDLSTVGQYTGLKDKNGKEIWEGDVIKDTGGCAPKIGAVIYKNGEFGGLYDFPKQDNVCGFCEIIGNIHDNLELLK